MALTVSIGPVLAQGELADEAEPKVIGTPSGFSRGALDEQMMSVPAGTALYRLPDLRSSALGRVDFEASLAVVERKTGWALVRYGSRTGWMRVAGEQNVDVGALDLRPPDPSRIARAREILGPKHTATQMGPFVFYTNLRDDKLVDRLKHVGNRVVATYSKRYGVNPGHEFDEVVVVFKREAEYRRYEDPESALVDLEAAGHTGFGLATLYAGTHGNDEIAALLVHEMTHLLNRRAFGSRLSAWLEEGLCEDLGFSKITRNGRLEPSKLSGGREESEWSEKGPDGEERSYLAVRISGAVASLKSFIDAVAVDGAPELDQLTDLAWAEFVDPARRSLNYSASGLLVRYLIAGDGGIWAVPFRQFLQGVAAGGRADGESLMIALGLSWDQLEGAYMGWIGNEARAAGVDAGAPTEPSEETTKGKGRRKKQRKGWRNL